MILGTNLITIGVKNQAPQVSFKNSVFGDYISVSSHEFTDVMDSDSLDILEAISCYRAQVFSLHGPRPPLPSCMITCTLPYNDNEIGDILHSLGNVLLKPRCYFTSHGSMFKDEKYHFLRFTSRGFNYEELFLFHQCTSVSLHGPIIYYAHVYVPDSDEHIHVLPKRKIHLVLIILLESIPDLSTYF